MLSFMREQGPEDSSVQQPPSTAGKTPADRADKTKEQEYLTVSAKSKSVRKSTILLAVLFVIGLLGLWFMIKKSAPRTADAAGMGGDNKEETLIEMAITRLTGVRKEIFQRMDEIVKKFYEFSDVQQVKVNDLVKNPFERETFLGITEENPNVEKKDFSMIRRQTRNMQLLSIMRSDKGKCCMIDDKILYEGDSIKDFKVCQIGDTFVKVEKDGMGIVLKLLE